MTDITKQQIEDALGKIEDPEMFVDIVSLGLIYDISITGQTIHIQMTMTTPACPLGPWFEEQITQQIQALDESVSVEVEFTFDPPWGMHMMSEDAKIALGVL